MSKISERIAQIIRYKNVSVRSFEASIGCSNGVIARVIGKNTDLSASWLQKIIELNPMINAEWLLTGKGEMLLNSSAIVEEPVSTYIAKRAIPLIPLSFTNDFLNASTDDDKASSAIEQYILPDFRARGVDFLVRQSGSSMVPTYNNGDILACRKVGVNPFCQWGNVYVICTEQGILVKRLFEGIDSQHILLQSDNIQQYPNFSVPTSSITLLAMVVGLIRTE